MNALDYLNKFFPVELINPNPRMSSLQSGDRFTVTFEITKEFFDELIATGPENRRGMILEGALKVTSSGAPIGEVDDDGNLVYQEPVKEEPKPEKRTTQSLAQWCGARCADPVFRSWLRETFMSALEETPTEDQAAKLIRDVLYIDSRSVIDTDPEIQQAFRRLIMEPWHHFCQSIEYKDATHV